MIARVLPTQGESRELTDLRTKTTTTTVRIWWILPGESDSRYRALTTAIKRWSKALQILQKMLGGVWGVWGWKVSI